MGIIYEKRKSASPVGHRVLGHRMCPGGLAWSLHQGDKNDGLDSAHSKLLLRFFFHHPLCFHTFSSCLQISVHFRFRFSSIYIPTTLNSVQTKKLINIEKLPILPS